jgi:hypothetical protein
MSLVTLLNVSFCGAALFPPSYYFFLPTMATSRTSTTLQAQAICRRTGSVMWLLVLLSALLVLAQGTRTTAAAAFSGKRFALAAKTSVAVVDYSLLPSWSSLALLRGGADDEEEEELDYEVEEEEEEGEEDGTEEGALAVVLDKVYDVTTKATLWLGKHLVKTSVATAKAFQRAIQAALQGDDSDSSNEEDDEESEQGEVSSMALTIGRKIIKTLQRMVKAALNPPPETLEDTDNNVVASVKAKSKRTSSDKKVNDADQEEEQDDDAAEAATEATIASLGVSKSDFGSFLSKSYGIVDERDVNDGPAMLGGSLVDALGIARSQARLLVVFLPSSKPTSNNKKKTPPTSADAVAMESLLSKSVAEAANKRARSKSTSSGGSFLLWGAKMGSSESATALKRLKAKLTGNKGEKRPLLAVVYPAVVRTIPVCSSLHDVCMYVYVYCESRKSAASAPRGILWQIHIFPAGGPSEGLASLFKNLIGNISICL